MMAVHIPTNRSEVRFLLISFESHVVTRPWVGVARDPTSGHLTSLGHESIVTDITHTSAHAWEKMSPPTLETSIIGQEDQTHKHRGGVGREKTVQWWVKNNEKGEKELHPSCA